MADPDLIQLFIEPLEELQIAYMITGGVASVIYGDPRFTRDIDIVLELEVVDVARLALAFASDHFYVPPTDILEREARRVDGGHFNIIHHDTALRADIYTKGRDLLHAWAFERRVRLPLDRAAVWIAPIEYVVTRKLQYYQASESDRHLRDVAMMLRISGDSVNQEELRRWTVELGLTDALASAADYPL